MKRLLSIAVFFSWLIPSVVFAIVPTDPFYPSQWYLPHISADDAWEVTTGSRAVVVAIVDAGIDLDHPDLLDNIWINVGEIPNNGIDDDGNGFIDDLNGWDFIDNDNSPIPTVTPSADLDAISHGSTIAGVIGAVGNNGQGMTGINWQVQLMSVRTLDEIGIGNAEDTARAIDYAVENGANVINLSFTGDDFDSLMQDAVKRAFEAGVVVVAAIGNDDRNLDVKPAYPACFVGFPDDWIIGVAAFDEQDQKASFSNFGRQCTDLGAPGTQIKGLQYHDQAAGFIEPYNGIWSGTSVAAPMVSGAAALLLSQYPRLTPTQVQNILMLSVDPIDQLARLKGKLGAGRLNIARALEYGASFLSQDDQDDITFVRSQSFAAVYALGPNQTRLVVLDTNTYFTYKDSFDEVMVLSDEELQHYSLAGIVLPKAGVVLVKIKSDSRVYLLEVDRSSQFTPIIRAIGSEEVAIVMFGSDWADYIIDIEPTFFTKFKLGRQIISPESVNLSMMKTRQQLAELSK